MTAAKLDRSVCRSLAERLTGAAKLIGGDLVRIHCKVAMSIADQLTAAAEMAGEVARLTELNAVLAKQSREQDTVMADRIHGLEIALRDACDHIDDLHLPDPGLRAESVRLRAVAAAADQRAIDALPPGQRAELGRRAAGLPVPGVPVVGIGPDDTEVIVEALEFLARPRCDKCTAAARIRAALTGTVPS